MYRWYLPFSAGNLAPGSLEIQSRNELTCLLNSPLLSAGSTQSVTLPVVDCALNVNDYSSHILLGLHNVGGGGGSPTHHSRLRQVDGFVVRERWCLESRRILLFTRNGRSVCRVHKIEGSL